MTSYDLLYVLEKVRTASPDKFQKFYTYGDSEDHKACVQLEKDGLIELYSEEYLWQAK